MRITFRRIVVRRLGRQDAPTRAGSGGSCGSRDAAAHTRAVEVSSFFWYLAARMPLLIEEWRAQRSEV